MLKNTSKKVKHDLLKKLTVGALSCTFGCVLIGGATATVVHGETTVESVAVDGSYDLSALIATLPPSKVTPTLRFEKSDASSDEVANHLISEGRSSEQLVHVSLFGESDNLVRDVPISQLTEKLRVRLGENFNEAYSFVTMDGSYLTKENILYLVEKPGRIINTEADYNQLVVELLTTRNTTPLLVYASFDLEKSAIDILLDGVGLGMAGPHKFTTINDIGMYAGTLRMATSGETINKSEIDPLGRTLEDYIKNDAEILALIKASGALQKETEAERVRAWAEYVKNRYGYDIDAYYAEGHSYSVASSIFSAIERGQAMCVGFSVLSARAYNMMGIRAYVTHGRMAGSGGAAHAITRVYYEDKWHFVDTTSGLGGSSSYLLDTYKATTASYAGSGEMTVYPAIETWMEQQKPKDLLLINKEITNDEDLINLDMPISDEEKNNIIEQYRLVLERFKVIRDSEKVQASSPDTFNSPINQVNGFIKEIEENQAKFSGYTEVLRTAANRHQTMINGFSSYAGQFEREYNVLSPNSQTPQNQGSVENKDDAPTVTPKPEEGSSQSVPAPKTGETPPSTTQSTTKPTTQSSTKNTSTPKTKSSTQPAPKPASQLKAVYRLYHAGKKAYLYTTHTSERDTLKRRGWKYEGVAWKTETEKGVPVYRLYHPKKKVHFYTRNVSEYQLLASRGWNKEGIAYRSYGSVPIYRLYHTGQKKYFYTRSTKECKILSKRGWKYEGVAWHSQP